MSRHDQESGVHLKSQEVSQGRREQSAGDPGSDGGDRSPLGKTQRATGTPRPGRRSLQGGAALCTQSLGSVLWGRMRTALVQGEPNPQETVASDCPRSQGNPPAFFQGVPQIHPVRFLEGSLSCFCSPLGSCISFHFRKQHVCVS